MAKVAQSTNSSSLAEVVDRILDKGIVIDAWAKLSLVGIELLTLEAPRGRGVGGDVPEVRGGHRPDRDGCGSGSFGGVALGSLDRGRWCWVTAPGEPSSRSKGVTS